MKNLKVCSLKGMHDFYGNDVVFLNKVKSILINIVNNYGFNEIKLPILERTILYKKIINYDKDNLDKEMYSFYDKNKLNISLRPEGTPGCVRLYIENNLFLNNFFQKLWYFGPMFRREKPQRGRFRQFYQLGLEILGVEDLNIDLELILVIKRFWENFGVNNFINLKINNIGTLLDRKKYIRDFIVFLRKRGIFRKFIKYKMNPLRLLESKDEYIKNILIESPKIVNYVNEKSLIKFELLCNKLKNFNIKYTIDYNLIRGLDYYNDFVFEWYSNDFNFAICSGGRYDKLAYYLGGFHLPAIGCALGIDRFLIILKYYNKYINLNVNDVIDIYIISYNMDISRNLGVEITENILNLNIKNIKIYHDYSLYKNINRKILRVLKLKIHLLIIIGLREINSNFITLKDIYLNKLYKVSKDKLIKKVINILHNKKIN